MNQCPRCHRECLELDEALNAISHIGEHVQICSICGTNQGTVGMGFSNDIVEIEMENRFKRELDDK